MCVFSLELPHRGDSNEYTQYTIFNIKKKICKYGIFFPKGPKKEFKRAVVNETSVFKSLKAYYA